MPSTPACGTGSHQLWMHLSVAASDLLAGAQTAHWPFCEHTPEIPFGSRHGMKSGDWDAVGEHTPPTQATHSMSNPNRHNCCCPCRSTERTHRHSTPFRARIRSHKPQSRRRSACNQDNRHRSDTAVGRFRCPCTTSPAEGRWRNSCCSDRRTPCTPQSRRHRSCRWDNRHRLDRAAGRFRCPCRTSPVEGRWRSTG